MNIIEIFDSINGEVNGAYQGVRSTFIRFAGCNLRCSYCDTPDSRIKFKGKNYSVDEIVNKIIEIGNPVIVLTGGEPLLYQNDIIDIACSLYNKDFYFAFVIETNGTCELQEELQHSYVDSMMVVVDYKLPSSGISSDQIEFDFDVLDIDDIVKFVISDESDFQVFNTVYHLFKNKNFKMAVSANTKSMSYKKLFELLQKNKIHDVIFNVQIHKLIDFK